MCIESLELLRVFGEFSNDLTDQAPCPACYKLLVFCGLQKLINVAVLNYEIR